MNRISIFSKRLLCVNSVRIRSYSVQMRGNTDQNKSEYRHFLRSANIKKMLFSGTKQLFSFSRYSNFCISIFPFPSKCPLLEVIKGKFMALQACPRPLFNSGKSLKIVNAYEKFFRKYNILKGHYHLAKKVFFYLTDFFT